MPAIITRGAISAQGYGYAAKKAGGAAVYVEDVFSTWLYSGTGSTQTINNGIDLATKGGMVWIKGRSGATDHGLYDTARGATFDLVSNSTAAQTTQSTGLTTFGTTGFTIGSLAKLNTSTSTYASWTFQKQSKFFDVVTYTGTGSQLNINHNLGSVPGMIIVKCTNATSNWIVYHRQLNGGTNPGQYQLTLNNTAGIGSTANSTLHFPSAPTSTQFTVGTNGNLNTSSNTYVAYLFAHDAGGFGPAGTDSVISCGSYTGNGSASGPTVTLGWGPQFVIIKSATAGSTGDWNIFDNMRGIPTGSADPYLFANTSGAEATTNGDLIDLTPTGFVIKSTDAQVNTSSGTYIYLAIRRGPMRTPTDATKVFIPITSSAAVGTVQTTGFPIDSQWKARRVGDTLNTTIDDRVRGVSTTTIASGRYLTIRATSAEATTSATTQAFNNNSFQIPTYYGGVSSIYWNFARAPGFFDVVCYTGTGSAGTVAHSLGVAPELIVIKRLNLNEDWAVYAKPVGAGSGLFFNYSDAAFTTAFFNSTEPTSSVFSVGTLASVNASASTYVAYLFASCPGVSKVGSYTGNGSSQTINCGFTAGARFVLIKRTSAIGEWYVWDTARGIVSGNDPRLSLDSLAGEVTTDDSIDPASSGFIVNQLSATNINVSSATYIYLAIA